MRLKVLLSVLFVAVLGLAVASADEIERLLHDARSPVLQVRLQALQALGNSGDIRAVAPLLTALHDESPSIRACAVAALRALVQALQGVYTTITQWIVELLTPLEESTTAPPPPVEKTWHL